MDEEPDLQSVLLNRQLGSGMSRIAPQLHPSVESNTWNPLYKALGQLPESMQDTMPDIRFEHVDYSPYTMSRGNAMIDRKGEHPAIVIKDGGPIWQSAKGGNADGLKNLAALLGHEQHHVLAGPSEGPAYDIQIELLKRMNAPKRMIDSVATSKQAALTGIIESKKEQ
jgi:hypothetical protein